MKGRIWINRVASENFNITTFDHVKMDVPFVGDNGQHDNEIDSADRGFPCLMLCSFMNQLRAQLDLLSYWKDPHAFSTETFLKYDKLATAEDAAERREKGSCEVVVVTTNKLPSLYFVVSRF